MTKVMSGVKVLEVAQFTFVPTAGAILADWGADVIKVEHPTRGDAQRGIVALQKLAVNPHRNMIMQHPNRGKRSIGIDLTCAEGQALLYEMAAQCDVFLTNYLPEARAKCGIDVEDIRKHNPDIIYVRGSALGDKGPERDKGGFDANVFWARAGSGWMVTPPELEVPLGQPGPAYGDTIGGMNLAGGIAAALFHRGRTGEAVEVDVSLLSSGVWATACSIDVAMETGTFPYKNDMPKSGGGAGNPFVGVFRTADGGAINLTMIVPGPYIRDTFEHLGIGEYADDPRFRTADALMENWEAASALMQEAFARHDFSFWVDRLKTLRGQWAPYQSTLEVSRDPQVIANDMILEVEPADGGTPLKLVANPVQFDHAGVSTTRAPEPWEHTELILMEMSVEWSRIGDLKSRGAIA